MNFDAEAVQWDNVRREKRAKIIADEITKSITIGQHDYALEFGCGTGLVSFNLSDKFKHITLIDTSAGMIDILNKKIRDSNMENMTALQIDINNDTLPEGRFDVVYTSMALHHIADTRTTLKNLWRLIGDNGYLCIVELDEDDGSFHKSEEGFDGHNGFNQNVLKKLLKEVGFKSVVTNTFYNDNKMIDGSKVNYSLFLMVGEKNI